LGGRRSLTVAALIENSTDAEPEMLSNTWSILCESAVFIMFGFVIAGLLDAVVPADLVNRLLSGSRRRSVLLATLIGVPLPLCSCSVLPAAVTLRKNGAGKGATLAFLISTPETSATSVLLTYSLLGPLMAVFRPIASCVTALAAGLIENAVERRFPGAAESQPEARSACCCKSEPVAGAQPSEIDDKRPSRLRGAMRYAFVKLFDDIFGWILIGILAAAAIQTWLPREVLLRLLGGPIQSMLLMLVIGVPLYICAEASTPVAAALILGGLNPGAALVLLLVGPATNIGSLGVLTQQFGRRSIAIYLATIVVVALIMGVVLNQLLIGRGFVSDIHVMHEPLLPDWLKTLGAVAFLAAGLGTLARNRHVRNLTARARSEPRP